MSLCKDLLAPGIAAFNLLTNVNLLCQLVDYDDTLAALCKEGLTKFTSHMLLPVHYEILCAVMCCCNLHPNIGKVDQDLRQNCVLQTLDEVDAMLDQHSRYKAEVSFNMRAVPPRPLMDKDDEGNLNTRPLRFGDRYRMMERINRDYPEVGPLGEKDVRRPDVLIVDDPSRPPTHDNILRVVEMKFPGDTDRRGQLEDYRAIGTLWRMTVQSCGCSDDDRTKRQLELVMASKKLWESQPSTLQKAALLVGAGLLAIGTVAALLYPWDGNAGETVLGTATLKTGTKALAGAAMTQAVKKASSLAAAAAWTMIYNPGRTQRE